MAAIISRTSLLPVTALEFCRISGSLYLLAGEGPHLKVFSSNGYLITQVELLPFCTIHGIRPSCVDDDTLNVLVFGQKTFRLVAILASCTSQLRIEHSQDIVCLNDWILDMCWLNGDRDSVCKVAAVTAHNVVHIIECSGDAVKMTKYHCEVNCILYSAWLDGSSESDITVLSGTVFNEILLWWIEGERLSSTHTKEERVKVKLSLIGHEGVIFSIRLNAEGSRLVSVSDDRSVRVWDIPSDWKSMERSQQSSCSLVLYGHTARVWDSRLLPDCVISVGEDATCRVWGYGGECLQVVEGHRGRSIWSMAVDESSGLVATGGGDCSIRLFSLEKKCRDNIWSLDTTLSVNHTALDDGSHEGEEVPRSVVLCDQTALCLSNTGALYAREVTAPPTAADKTVWRLVHQDREFSGYAAMSLSPSHQWLALGSLQGCIALLLLEKNGVLVTSDVKWCAHKGKVFSLTWLNSFNGYSHTLLSCGPNGEMVVWGIDGSSVREPNPLSTVINPLVHLSLPSSKHRWVTSAILLPSQITSVNSVVTIASEPSSSSRWLVCGDRKGSLHVYQINLSSQSSHANEPVQSLSGIHGANGVTHITVRDGHVVTCGRDGHCRVFSLHPHIGLTELTKYKPVKGMDWIESVFYSNTDQLVLGFHTTEMVLYSVTQNRCIMSINCGGGHRSYGITSLPKLCVNKKAVAVYIKKSVISFKMVDLSAQLTTPVLQKGFVGREAVSLQVIHSDPVTGDAVIAVGSEDCSVCLLSLQPSCDGRSVALKTERFVQGHISSVRALSTSQSVQGPPHQILLFSGGARASLKVWKIHVDTTSASRESEVTLEAEFSLHEVPESSRRKMRKKPKGPGAESLLPECRIMALTSLPLSQIVEKDNTRHYVVAGCSDGIIRHYIYNEETHNFSSLGKLEFHSRSDRTLCVLSAATDGRVVLWSIPTELLVSDATGGARMTRSDTVGSGDLAQPLAVCQAHQSGVNDIAIQQVNEKCYYISTVGDDNKLAVLILTISDSLHPVHLEVLCTEPNAHASSITGTSFLSPSLIVTTSIDQRMCVWRVCQDQATVSSADTSIAADTSSQCSHIARVNQVYSHTHDIADVSSLAVYEWRANTVVVMCGIGTQCFIINY